MKNVVKRIIKERELQGKSAADLAHILGVSESDINRKKPT